MPVESAFAGRIAVARRTTPAEKGHRKLTAGASVAVTTTSQRERRPVSDDVDEQLEGRIVDRMEMVGIDSLDADSVFVAAYPEIVRLTTILTDLSFAYDWTDINNHF